MVTALKANAANETNTKKKSAISITQKWESHAHVNTAQQRRTAAPTGPDAQAQGAYERARNTDTSNAAGASWTAAGTNWTGAGARTTAAALAACTAYS